MPGNAQGCARQNDVDQHRAKFCGESAHWPLVERRGIPEFGPIWDS
jgi:hypothetical protein